MAVQLIKNEDGIVRMSDDDLHRAVSKAIWEGNHIVFESLPGLIAQIIEHKTWKTFGHKSFADYALDAGTNGLGINTNQRLWMLRCAMDVHGKHVGEWAKVLTKVDEMVRIQAKSDGAAIRAGRGFDGNSLETLAKNVDNVVNSRITYMPSMNKADDGHLVRLSRKDPKTFKRVVAGELSLVEARRAAGMPVAKVTNLGRAKSAWSKMTPEERAVFIQWLQDNGYV